MSKVYFTCKGIKQFTDEWFNASKQITRTIEARYQSSIRAKKYGVENTLTLFEWREILAQSQGICFYCNHYIGVDRLTIDHFIPMSKGGSNIAQNVVACCLSCNNKKRATIPNEFFIRKLLNPESGLIITNESARTIHQQILSMERQTRTAEK